MSEHRVNFHSNEWYIENLKDSKKLAEKSKRLYVCLMKKILRETKCDNLHDILINPSKHMKNIVNKDTPTNTQDSIFGTILSFLYHSGLKEENPSLYEEWHNEFSKINKIKQEISRSNIPSERQKKGILNWNDVLIKRDEQVYGSLPHLLLSMYTYIPPRRQLDYAVMRVYFDPSLEPLRDHNHFHVYNKKYDSAYILISEYKTKYSYNDYFDTDIPNELVSIIIHSFQQNPRRYMFMTERGRPFTDANHFQIFSNNILKEIFKNRNVSVNSLRHSFASRLKSLNNLSVHEHDILSRKMGHSLTKNLEYAFFDEENQKNEKMK